MIWVEGANPWYLVAFLAATVLVLFVTLMVERRHPDPWDDLARRDRGRR